MLDDTMELTQLIADSGQQGTDSLLSAVSQIPGYEVIEYDGSCTRLHIPSGFILDIHRLGPYVFDALRDRDDLHDEGPFKITVRLMEKLRPPGVEQTIIYAPPDKIPDKEDHPQAWAYYQQWLIHQHERAETRAKLVRAQIEFILLSAVRVVDGPIKVDGDGDGDWSVPLEDMIPIPSTIGGLTLLFYKTHVIRSELTAVIIRELSTTREVTIKGIKHALDTFPCNVARQASVNGDG